MIPASKKMSFTEVPESLSSQLSQTLSKTEEGSAETDSESKASETITKVQNTESEKAEIKAEEKTVKKNDRNGQINICVPPETKTEWKLLFTKNNVNITQGIIFAVEHLKNEIENGEAILTVGGVIAKK